MEAFPSVSAKLGVAASPSPALSNRRGLGSQSHLHSVLPALGGAGVGDGCEDRLSWRTITSSEFGR